MRRYQHALVRVEWAHDEIQQLTSLSTVASGAVIRASWLAWSVVNNADTAALEAAHGPTWHMNYPYCNIDTDREMDEKFEGFIEKAVGKGRLKDKSVSITRVDHGEELDTREGMYMIGDLPDAGMHDSELDEFHFG